MRLSGAVLAAIGGAAVIAGFAWGWPGATAQQGKAPAAGTGTTTLQVYSRETVVDVTATDASGRPVQGLQRDEFTILEDGKPQPIRSFSEVNSQYVEPPRQLPANVYTNLEPPAPSSAVNVILLDFANEAPVDSTNMKQVSYSTYLQDQVKQAAMQAIDQMPAGTRVAVIAMTNSLHIMQGFTSNQAILKAAVNAAPYDLNGMGNTQNVQADMRNRMVLEAFDQIAADVAPMKGRKNLIWFSMGVWTIVDPNHTGSLPDYSKPLSEAYDLLTAAQVSVYPVYAGGVGRLGEQQLSLEMVADATGGVAYSGTNDLATAVVKALEDGANYYAISYVPPSDKLNGVYHKIEVKVDRPDVHLVFRKGYYADDLAKIKLPAGLTLSMAPPPANGGNMKAPMSRGMATSSELVFDVGVEPSNAPPKPGDPPVMGTLDPKLKGKRLTRYGFTYVVPAEQIKFVDGPKVAGGITHVGKVDFDIAVYDADDKLLTGLSQTLTMPLSDSSYQQMMKNHTPVRFFQQIDLPQGQLFVRVGVLDKTTNKDGTLELPVKVGKEAKAPAAPAGE
jgi:VWFA-related protein